MSHYDDKLFDINIPVWDEEEIHFEFKIKETELTGFSSDIDSGYIISFLDQYTGLFALYFAKIRFSVTINMEITKCNEISDNNNLSNFLKEDNNFLTIVIKKKDITMISSKIFLITSTVLDSKKRTIYKFTHTKKILKKASSSKF